MPHFLNLSDFELLTESEIRQLRGGRKHNFRYFIGIRDSENSQLLETVLRARLTNQRGSQRSSRYPAGYEPFLTPYGERSFCLRHFRFPVPTLRFVTGQGNPSIHYLERDAVILKNPGGDRLEYLSQTAERFLLEYKTVKAAAGPLFPIVSDLLRPSSSRSKQSVATSAAEGLRVFELRRRNVKDERLRDLMALLEFPETVPTPPIGLKA